MITGDHAGTAAAIAAKVGLYGASAGALTGAQLALLDDDQLAEAPKTPPSSPASPRNRSCALSPPCSPAAMSSP
jgi:hypothetical protein